MNGSVDDCTDLVQEVVREWILIGKWNLLQIVRTKGWCFINFRLFFLKMLIVGLQANLLLLRWSFSLYSCSGIFLWSCSNTLQTVVACIVSVKLVSLQYVWMYIWPITYYEYLHQSEWQFYLQCVWANYCIYILFADLPLHCFSQLPQVIILHVGYISVS